MSDKSINEQIHELMGKCVHEWKRGGSDIYWLCAKCEYEAFDVNNIPNTESIPPDYTSDLTACFNGPVEWMRKTKFLEIWINNESSDHWNVEIIPVSKADPIAVADDASLARAICMAILAAMKEKS